MDRGRCSTRNVPRQRSLLQRDWPGLRLHVPARLAHKSSISSQISFLLFKEGLEPRSKLEQQQKQVFKADLEPLRYTRPLNHRYYDLSPLFVNFYALGFICSWHNHAHTMGLHALAKAPSPTQALKIKMYRGQIKPEFFLQEPPDKRMTRIGMGGPKTRAIFEEVL